MIDMNLINEKVKHGKWGIGVIIEPLEIHYITVEFECKTIKFQNPGAFENHITAEDTSLHEKLLLEIEDAKAAELAEALKLKILKDNEAFESKFGKDYNVKYLATNPVLTYQKVEELYEIKIKGFGKGINRAAGAIVLISSIDKKKDQFVYHDHWTLEGDYIYSGEGKSGDQKLTAGNLAIANAAIENKTIYLFVKFSPQEYNFQGVFDLASYTYDDEEGSDGKMRKEYKFRLKKVINADIL